MLRSFFPPSVKYNWAFGLAMIIIFTIIRFYVILNANVAKDYGNASILFTIMALTPFLFLNKEGRKYIGITKPSNYRWLILSFILGAIVCTLIYVVSTHLYGHSFDNSLAYIANSYRAETLTLDNKFTFFIIYAISCMIFSPLGEELFYRGLIHGSFQGQFGNNKASIIDSLTFAVAHLSHFGVVYILGEWKFLPIPALVWFIGMFILCRVFFLCRQKSGSILGSILSHAGFNLAMIYWIFYHIL